MSCRFYLIINRILVVAVGWFYTTSVGKVSVTGVEFK